MSLQHTRQIGRIQSRRVEWASVKKAMDLHVGCMAVENAVGVGMLN